MIGTILIDTYFQRLSADDVIITPMGMSPMRLADAIAQALSSNSGGSASITDTSGSALTSDFGDMLMEG